MSTAWPSSSIGKFVALEDKCFENLDVLKFFLSKYWKPWYPEFIDSCNMTSNDKSTCWLFYAFSTCFSRYAMAHLKLVFSIMRLLLVFLYTAFFFKKFCVNYRAWRNSHKFC